MVRNCIVGNFITLYDRNDYGDNDNKYLSDVGVSFAVLSSSPCLCHPVHACDTYYGDK